MGEAECVVLLLPLMPAFTGNGLAMRAGMLLDALASVAVVHVVVVPVSGGATDRGWTKARARSLTVIPPVTPNATRDHVTMQLADSDLRARLERTAPVPALAALAPPTLADTIAAALPDEARHPVAVLAMRLYLAPLGIQLARILEANRGIVDVDDDDAKLLRALGDNDQADACDRLATCWLPDADVVIAASAPDAASIATRAGLAVIDVVPNAVALPPIAPPPPPGAERLLFVGNLTYLPNQDAARELAVQILPQVRERHPNATLELVGPLHGGQLDDLARIDGVSLTGAVPDVAPHYDRADVVVVPLRHGGGTRIKVLEAFAHRRLVVATPTAVAGLDVADGREAVIVDSPSEIARAVADHLDHHGPGTEIVERAVQLVARRYVPEVVAPLVRAAVVGSPTA